MNWIVETPDGLHFLEQYYGLEQVADLVMEEVKNGVDFGFDTKEKIITWLQEEGKAS